MSYSPLPSAPPGRSIYFHYGCPVGYTNTGNLFETEEKKEELCQIADRIVNVAEVDGADVQAVVSGFFFDFIKGSVTINANREDGNSISTDLDVISTRFIQEQKEYIAYLNPELAVQLENASLREEAEKITNIYFELFNKYMKGQKKGPESEDLSLWNSTVRSVVPGFKEMRNLEIVETMSLKHVREESGEKFKKFIQTLPTSLLSSKKAFVFLQEGLEQKSSKADKILYLKQVLFFLTFQEVFKNILENISTDLAISKEMRYVSSNYDHESERIYQSRMQRIQTTLSQLPVNDVLMLIPLACRASVEELSSNDPNDPFPFIDDIRDECNRARRADIAFTRLLKNSFGKELKSFSVPTDHFNHWGLRSIEQFLMGVSGLAIQSGSGGRFPMYDHRTLYYKREELARLKPASDNAPLEFLMTAAQFYPERDDSWIEERCLAYLAEMMGKVSHHELDGIKAKLRKVRQAVDRAPAEILIKEKAPNQYVLRNSSLKKFESLFEEAKLDAGLAPCASGVSSRFKRLAL